MADENNTSGPVVPEPTLSSPSTAVPEITLHYLDSSRSHRILWLLEELKLPYKVQVHFRKSTKLAPESLKAVHPLGKAPVLEVQPAHGDKITIAESANVVEFLLRHYGPQFVPAQFKEGTSSGPENETEAFRRYRYLMHTAEGTVMPFLVFGIILNMLKGTTVPFLVRPISRAIAGQVENAFTKPNNKANFELLEDMLKTSGGDYFCGKELSGADFMMEYPLSASQNQNGLTKEKYPQLFAFVDRVHEREAYKLAVKKAEESMGKPFSLKL